MTPKAGGSGSGFQTGPMIMTPAGGLLKTVAGATATGRRGVWWKSSGRPAAGGLPLQCAGRAGQEARHECDLLPL